MFNIKYFIQGVLIVFVFMLAVSCFIQSHFIVTYLPKPNYQDSFYKYSSLHAECVLADSSYNYSHSLYIKSDSFYNLLHK